MILPYQPTFVTTVITIIPLPPSPSLPPSPVHPFVFPDGWKRTLPGSLVSGSSLRLSSEELRKQVVDEKDFVRVRTVTSVAGEEPSCPQSGDGNKSSSFAEVSCSLG